MGVEKHYKRQTIRKDVIKVIAEPERLSCPRYDQIRQLAFHRQSAKGPLYARSMARKLLGNEEFCVQVDAHSSFRKNWDVLAKADWKKTNNEFAVLSHAPAKQSDETEHADGGTKETEVPRQCKVQFQDNGVPVSLYNNSIPFGGTIIRLKLLFLSLIRITFLYYRITLLLQMVQRWTWKLLYCH